VVEKKLKGRLNNLGQHRDYTAKAVGISLTKTAGHSGKKKFLCLDFLDFFLDMNHVFVVSYISVEICLKS
jgi:hypothetical protein